MSPLRLALIAATACSSAPANKTPAPAPATVATEPKVEPPEPPPPSGPCRGRDLDLHAIATRALCPLDELAPPEALVASIPVQTAPAPDFDWIAIELRNPGDEAVTAAINPRMAIASEGVFGGQIPTSKLGYRVTVEPGGVVRMRARCLGACARQPGERVELDVVFLGALGEIVRQPEISGTVTVKQPPATDPAPPEPQTPPVSASPRIVASSALMPLLIAGERQPRADRKTAAKLREVNRKAIAVYKVCVDAHGQVTGSKKLRASGYATYDLLVEAAIATWLFKPFEVDGHPTPVCTAVTFIEKPGK